MLAGTGIIAGQAIESPCEYLDLIQDLQQPGG
jgi:hypothetical protein